ncbi:MAG: hypothetical protein J5780_00945 [Treponema sp.]|nr:hypothetical protein [Treponema sp.]
MKALNFLMLFFYFSFASVLCSCGFLCEKEEVSFFLPDTYNEQSVTFWKVTVCDSNGICYSKICEAGKNAALEFNRNALSSVLAFPSDVSGANPYGTVYPFDFPVDYKNGFASLVLYSLFLSSENTPAEKEWFLSRFNWQRFIKECAQLDDPWLLDKEQIMNAIAEGKFRKNLLK